ncbi:MAG: PilZ domain-containing protein [Deltaproteobacteria bacterium]|nr:PilZ domain-containing protein [Deltaproteobacteria bacterium]
MKILYAPFTDAEDFLARLDVGEDAGLGRLTVTTRARYPAGEAVVLEIGFRGLPNRVLVRTSCIGSPSEGVSSAAAETGADVGEHPGSDAIFEVSPGEEHKRDFLVAIAAGRAKATWKRKNRRFPIRLPARFVAEGQDVPLRGDAETEDIGGGGVFLKTPRSLPEGSRVTIVLDPCDGSAEMEFAGRVVYSRKEDGASGLGVQFDRLNNDDMQRLRRLIRGVKVQGKVIEWEDASRLV